MHMLSRRHHGESRSPDAVLTAERPTPETRRQCAQSPAVVFENVSLAFDDHVVLRNLSFTVERGSMMVLLGASGSGKSIVLKLVLGLLRPDSGRITVNGQHIDGLAEPERMRVRGDIGMMFQENALFDSLTVAENVVYVSPRRWANPNWRSVDESKRCSGSSASWTTST